MMNSARSRTVFMQPKPKLGSSNLPHRLNKSSGVKTGEHTQVTIYGQIRSCSGVQSPTDLTTDNSRRVTVSTQTSDWKPSRHLSHPLKVTKDQTVKQSPAVSSPETRFPHERGRGSVVSSICNCPCHNQPTVALRRHATAGESSVKVEQRTVSDVRYKRISDGSETGARGQRTREGGGAFSQKIDLTGSYWRASWQADPPRDSDDKDDAKDASYKYMYVQRLKSAVANRFTAVF